MFRASSAVWPRVDAQLLFVEAAVSAGKYLRVVGYWWAVVCSFSASDPPQERVKC